MAPVSRLGRQIQEVIRCLDDLGAASALIGGLELAPYRVIRATTDVDLLVDARLAEPIDGAIRSLGYECLHRSTDAANYIRGDERVDFLYASRPAAMDLLAGAVSHQTPFGEPRVVSLEGLIAFKLQGLVNDPRRSQDMEDIRALLAANRETVDLNLVRDYFRLFDKEYHLTNSSPRHADPPTPLTAFSVAEHRAAYKRPAVSSAEAFTVLDDLMAVIEALCTSWPAKPAVNRTPDLRL